MKGDRMMAASGRTQQRRKKLGGEPTVFAAHCDPQTVKAKVLKNTDYITGSTQGISTSKPAKYRA